MGLRFQERGCHLHSFLADDSLFIDTADENCRIPFGVFINFSVLPTDYSHL